MPKFLATFDLNSATNPYSHFLIEAREEQWDCWIRGDNDDWFRLPNATLIGNFDNRSAAVASFERVRAATSAVLGRPVIMEKWIIVEWDGAAFISDENHPNGRT